MHIKQKKIDLSTGIVMGILNLSSNSFYDGGKYNNIKKIIQHTERMIREGADIIDIGAQSSKPGSKEIKENQELQNLLFAIHEIKKRFPKIIISIDTYRSKVATECINNGADIINDISAGELDKNMFKTIAKLKVPYIIMHMQGYPNIMQKKPNYRDVVSDIINYFKIKIKKLRELGVMDIIIDPGFGFGKTIEHNYQILNNLKEFKKLNLPLMIGASRKSMIYNVLESTPEESLNGTVTINTMALQKGADIVRVHDVREAVESIKILNFAKSVAK